MRFDKVIGGGAGDVAVESGCGVEWLRLGALDVDAVHEVPHSGQNFVDLEGKLKPHSLQKFLPFAVVVESSRIVDITSVVVGEDISVCVLPSDFDCVDRFLNSFSPILISDPIGCNIDI